MPLASADVPRRIASFHRGSPVAVMIPFFIAGAVTVLNRGYMHPLYFTTKGHFLIGLGLVMMTLGSLVLKKIVSFRG